MTTVPLTVTMSAERNFLTESGQGPKETAEPFKGSFSMTSVTFGIGYSF
jgi:hypothetical protein